MPQERPKPRAVLTLARFGAHDRQSVPKPEVVVADAADGLTLRLGLAPAEVVPFAPRRPAHDD